MMARLKNLDPVQGLVDYVLDIKPYHTKIAEIIVEYVYNDNVAVVITDKWHVQVDITRPWPSAADNGACVSDGYGIRDFGDFPGKLIFSPDITKTFEEFPAINSFTSSIAVVGDVTNLYPVGAEVKLTVEIWDYTDVHNPVFVALHPNTGTYNVLTTTHYPQQIDYQTNPGDPNTRRRGDMGYTDVVLSPLLTDTPLLPGNQVYVAYVRAADLPILYAVPYSNYKKYFDPISGESIQIPDEGIIITNVAGVSIADQYFIVDGNLSFNNLFVGSIFNISGSDYNNGVYTVAAIEYDRNANTTKLSTIEPIFYDYVDGHAVFDIVSNSFIVEGNYVDRYVAGSRIKIINGTHSGTYDVVSSDRQSNFTRIRTVQTIFNLGQGMQLIGYYEVVIGSVTYQYPIVKGDLRSLFTVGTQFVIIGSDVNDGTYIVSAPSFLTGLTVGDTVLPIAEVILSHVAVGEIHRYVPGMIVDRDYLGYSEHRQICTNIPEESIRGVVADAIFFERVEFQWGQTYRWNIIDVNQTISAIYLEGDFTGILYEEDPVKIEFSENIDGNYVVQSFSYDANINLTEVILYEPAIPAQPTSIFGQFVLENVDIADWYQYLIVEFDAMRQQLVIQGNVVQDIQGGQEIYVLGSTDNDGKYTVIARPTFDGTFSRVSVNPTIIQGRGGWVEPARDYGIQIRIKDVVRSTFEEDATSIVNYIVSENDVLPAPQYAGGPMIGGWDVPHWDLDGWDETLDTIFLHQKAQQR
jgi:hypothetical protein